MTNKPLLSVVMPVFNRAEYVATAIESILNQSYHDFEFVIVDDASTDNSVEVIQKYKDSRIRLILNEKNAKTTITLNRGIKAAAGEYIVRMDSDDWSFPDRLEKQLNFMTQHPRIVECGGQVLITDERLSNLYMRKYPLDDLAIRNKLFYYNPFAHPATIWRKSAIETAGYYDESIPLTQDYDLTFRVGKLGQFANLDIPVIKLRMHDRSSSSAKGRKQQIITLQIRKKAVKEYGYKMKLSEHLWYLVQWVGLYILSDGIKSKIFNILRKFI